MPRYRQYAVYPYEQEFGFSPGFYGSGAQTMEVKMPSLGKGSRGKKGKSSSRLNPRQRAMFGEVSKMYVDREGAGTRALLFLGLPLTALTVYGIAVSAKKKARLKEMPTEPGVRGVGQIIAPPKIEFPGLEGLGTVGRVLPYALVGGMFLVGQSLVPKEWKVVRTALLLGGVAFPVLGLWSGLAYASEEEIPEDVEAGKKLPVPAEAERRRAEEYLARYLRIDPEVPSADDVWHATTAYHDAKVRFTNRGPEKVSFYWDSTLTKGGEVVRNRAGKSRITLGPVGSATATQAFDVEIPTPAGVYWSKGWNLYHNAYVDPALGPVASSFPTIGISFSFP